MPDTPTATPAEVAPVRPGEDLDWPAVERYLREHLPVADGAFAVLQFPNGSANLTYRIEIGARHYVLRRPPFGTVAHGGHDMRREFRALSVLWQGYERAPRALLHCEDTSVVGSEFIVVEYRPGIVVWGAVPVSMEHLDDAGRRIGVATVQALADLHRVDYAAVGLERLGRPDGFLERQVSGWLGRWEDVRPHDGRRDDVRLLGEALGRSLPVAQHASVLHNDFKIDNCQFQPGDPDRVTSVFDWDMATLGDPLVDLGTLLNYWPSDVPGDPVADVLATPGVETLGLPTKAEVVELYAGVTGFDVDRVAWYEALGCWRTAIIMQQLYSRYLRGETTDERMASRGAPVFDLARRGLSLVGADA